MVERVQRLLETIRPEMSAWMVMKNHHSKFPYLLQSGACHMVPTTFPNLNSDHHSCLAPASVDFQTRGGVQHFQRWKFCQPHLTCLNHLIEIALNFSPQEQANLSSMLADLLPRRPSFILHFLSND